MSCKKWHEYLKSKSPHIREKYLNFVGRNRVEFQMTHFLARLNLVRLDCSYILDVNHSFIGGTSSSISSSRLNI